jgi:hypothetical protein
MQALQQTPEKLDFNDDPNPTQDISGPDAGEAIELKFVACPEGLGTGNPGERCYRLSWKDPSGSPFNAPATYHYHQPPSDGTLSESEAPDDFQYCSDMPDNFTIVEEKGDFTFPKVSATPLDPNCNLEQRNDCWRFRYRTFGTLASCEKIKIRVCGGWCTEKIKVNGVILDRPSTEIGKLLTLENYNGCQQNAEQRANAAGR